MFYELILCLMIGTTISASNTTKDSTQSLNGLDGVINEFGLNWSPIPDQNATVCNGDGWPYYFCTNMSPNCFELWETCDGHDDCHGDSSDECESFCSQTFSCSTERQCIALDKFCDGVADCSDGSDEIEPDSTEDGFVCGNAWGIFLENARGSSWKEKRVPWNAEARQFFTQSLIKRQCKLPKNLVCDGTNHCGDHSDECNPLCDDDKKFICDNGRCIAKSHKCDGRDDCGDNSDEIGTFCSTSFNCASGDLISLEKFCDGHVDCKDGSDELVATSPNSDRTDISCSNRHNYKNKTCLLPKAYVCDGHEHCVSRVDECQADCHYSFTCANGNCIVANKKCNGRDDCGDMSDECGDDVTCSDVFTCDDGMCLPLDKFCDGNEDCASGEDEDDHVTEKDFFCSNRFNTENNKIFGLSSKRTCRLNSRFLCDGIGHCDMRVDECQGKCGFSYSCDNNQTCIPRTQLCDGVEQCRDKSDEYQAEGRQIPSSRGFKCPVERISGTYQCVIPQAFINDGTEDCSDKSDEMQPSQNTAHLTTCLTDQHIKINQNQVCDGVFDCPDLSDECLCQDVQSASICRHLCFYSNKLCQCGLGEVPCLIEPDDRETETQYSSFSTPPTTNITSMGLEAGLQCIPAEYMCNGIVHCRNSADEMYCGSRLQCHLTETDNQRQRKYIKKRDSDSGNTTCDLQIQCSRYKEGSVWTPKYGIGCDGHPECFDLDDECSDKCPSRPRFCNFTTPSGYYQCPEKKILAGRLVCDGIIDCPETEEDERDCPGRILCEEKGKTVSYKSNQKCDYVSDCDDESDEINCPESHFYCESGNPLYVRRRQMFDGKSDCEDGSDECPRELFKNSPFSSIDYLIKSPFLQAMVWIMGTLAIVGNALVMINTVTVLRHSKRLKRSKVSLVYNCLVLNLCIADFLMGVFLISLGVNNAVMAGKYCRMDHSWRSGLSCVILGVMAVLSSEVSLVTLSILSSYRLYCVLRPVNSRMLRMKSVLFFIMCTWIFAGLIAFLPFSNAFKEYFITHVWVNKSPYFYSEVIDKSTLYDFFNKFNGYSNVTYIASAQHGLQEISDNLSMFPSSQCKILGYFGYYSTHATCLPKMFVTMGEPAWQFSLAVNILNCLLCVYIVAAYAFIWRPRQINKTNIDSNATRSMQRRIAILVATDCSCWLPICIIAFLRVSGIDVPDSVYAFTAIVLLPINSALNPIFYSNAVQTTCMKLGRNIGQVESVDIIRKSVSENIIQKCRKKDVRQEFDIDLLNNYNGEQRQRTWSNGTTTRFATDHTLLDTAMNESHV